VLVVDDDPSTQRSVERLLRLRGLDCEAFESGEALLERGDVRAAVCVLLDIHLPGISGVQVCRRLAFSEASPPVIFMTANLSKPFSSQTLSDAIDAALALQRPAG
jgi:FixJ family two-component response regulator